MTILLAFSLTAALQGPDAIVARDSSARMERLADGVYAIIHDRATDGA
jgi:hypothetical protein